MRVASAASLLVLMRARQAFACPSCPTTGDVRGIVFGLEYWSNLGIATLPFIVIGIVALLAHRIGRGSKAA